MAASNFYNFPLDVPHIEGPGVMHRESNAPGNDSHIYVGPEHPIRKAKGDLGLETIKGFEPRSLTHKGSPFKNMKGGR